MADDDYEELYTRADASIYGASLLKVLPAKFSPSAKESDDTSTPGETVSSEHDEERKEIKSNSLEKQDSLEHSASEMVSFKEANILKLPKEMRGRWSSERYKAAQLKLVEILQMREARPQQPISRPALREEARKNIGDTGLLDHLLKHMTDTVVVSGDRFRRRHNIDGAMEYWLEEPHLMALRHANGINDPTWLPPPGWRPGTSPNCACLLHSFGSGESGMSPSDSQELSNLRACVMKLESELKKLKEDLARSSNVKRGMDNASVISKRRKRV